MNSIFDFAPSKQGLPEQIAQRIERLVISEALHTGDRLPGERELAEQMQVCRNIVREALRILGERGLVSVKSGCGTFVTRPSSTTAGDRIRLLLQLRRTPRGTQDLFEVRRILEIEVAGLAAARRKEKDCRDLDAAIRAMEHGRRSADAYVDADVSFHAALARSTGNELLPVLLDPISTLLRDLVRISYESPGSVDLGIAFHRRILGAVEAGDAEAAKTAMREHLDSAREHIERMEQSHV